MQQEQRLARRDESTVNRNYCTVAVISIINYIGEINAGFK